MKNPPRAVGGSFEGSKPMYQVNVRIYLTSDEVFTQAEYQRDYKNDQEVLARSSRRSARTPGNASVDHHRILTEVVQVCHELAQKLEVPLF